MRSAPLGAEDDIIVLRLDCGRVQVSMLMIFNGGGRVDFWSREAELLDLELLASLLLSRLRHEKLHTF
jgi:hypothetical protein